MGEFELECCNTKYKARKYKVEPYKENCIAEEYKVINCPKCGTLKIDYKRTIQRPNKKEFSYTKHPSGEDARAYLFNLHYDKIQVVEILDSKIEQGSSANLNWKYGEKNSIKNFNGKTIGSRVTNPINTIKASFTPDLQEVS